MTNVLKLIVFSLLPEIYYQQGFTMKASNSLGIFSINLTVVTLILMGNGSSYASNFSDTSASPGESIPPRLISQVFFGNSAKCNIDIPGTINLKQSDYVIGDKMTGLYLKYTQKCPDQAQVNELRYFWLKNQFYWQQYPSKMQSFLEDNLVNNPLGDKQKLIGKPSEEVRKYLLTNPSFPMMQEGEATIVGDMTWYSFIGGNVAYEIVVRKGIVSRIYLINLL
ncbi:MAG: hypothetical protein RLZZ338_3223 [Cyanobacteriota bacterium]|jgi:hypothetical protein